MASYSPPPRLVLAVLFFLLCFPLSAVAQESPVARPLPLGTPQADSLGPSGLHAFGIDLPAQRFVYGEVDQITVDVVVRVYGPDGALMGEFDQPARGPEPFRFETTAAGPHRIEVTPFRQESGRYEARLLVSEPIATTLEGRVDQLMAPARADSPGYVVALVQDGALRFVRAYGLANLEYGAPNTASTPYHMASVSKQFTAFAVALLAAEGRLSLDDDVRTHLPEMADFGTPITLRHLIHHTSGLRDQWNLWIMSGGRMDDVIRQEDLFRLATGQRELNFEPGTEYSYCNTGYMLLAQVVERVAGQPFGVFMRERVFEPLGMTSTQIYDDHERVVLGRAYSYQPDAGGFKKSVLSYANAGATSLFTTAEDLARWLHNFHAPTVGSPEVIAQMQERGVLAGGDTLTYAFGLVVDEHRGLKRLSHGGADAGYRTSLTYYPALDAGVVVLSNLSSASPGQVAVQMAELFLAGHMTAPPPPPEPEAPAPDAGHAVSPVLLAAYAGEYAGEEDFLVAVTHDGPRLYVQVAGQNRFPLTALSDTLFRVEVPGAEAQVAFHGEPDGGVRRATLLQNGTTALLRVEPWTPDADALSDYAGRYYSPELETYYALALGDGRLVAQHRRHGEIVLTPAQRDAFTGSHFSLRDVRFERDADGTITGMRVSNGRVRDLLLERVP